MYFQSAGTVGPGKNVDKIYTDGCLKALGDWINSNAIVAGGVLLGILIPQVSIEQMRPHHS